MIRVRGLERGDLIWADFEVPSDDGRMISTRRPALVISPSAYNMKSGLAVVCPVTSTIVDYPFDVPIPDGFPMQGSVISDEVRSIDWRVRNAVVVGRAPTRTVRDVIGLVASLLAGRA